jgi:prepilin peptidase CpaA
MWMTLSHAAPARQWAVVLGATLTAAIIDARSRRIPNWLTLGLLAAGLAWSGITLGRWGLADGLLGCVMLALPYIVLFQVAGGGAGDAKMMGALGAWLGLGYGTVVLVAVCISGAILGILYAVVRRRLASVTANIALVSQSVAAIAVSRQGLSQAAQLVPRPTQMLAMPYGLAICAGTWAAGLGIFLWHLNAH